MRTEGEGGVQQEEGSMRTQACFEDASLLALRMKGPLSPGTLADRKAGKGQGMDSLPDPPEETSPADPVILAH